MSGFWRLESATETGIFLKRKEKRSTVCRCSYLLRRIVLPSSPSWTGTCYAQQNVNKYAETISTLSR